MLDVDTISAHVAYRLGRFATDPIRLDPSLLHDTRAWGKVPPPKRISALTTRGKASYLPLNGFDREIIHENGKFQVREPIPIQRRRAFFGNEFQRSGVTSEFLLNPCDAQGWDYVETWPVLADAPVLQYCRLAEQRNQVALVPLNHAFAGPGSANLPFSGFDTTPFSAKKPIVNWRGRMSGTLQSAGGAQWLEGEFRNIAKNPAGANEEQINSLFKYPRPAIARQHLGSEWADIRMVMTHREEKMLDNMSLPPEIAPLFGSRQNREQQLAAKYLLCVDGNDVATGIYWALLSNSLVFKASVGWETILDFGLEPWVHFVPVSPDGTDLEERFLQCEADPAMCQQIIANANKSMQWALDAELRHQIDIATLQRYGEAMTEGQADQA